MYLQIEISFEIIKIITSLFYFLNNYLFKFNYFETKIFIYLKR